MAAGHVDDDVPNSLQLEVLDQEICLLQSAALWHVLAVRSVSHFGEKPLLKHVWRSCDCFAIVGPKIDSLLHQSLMLVGVSTRAGPLMS